MIGPKAREHQVKVVPQSGSAWFRYLKPSATNSIGTKASTMMIGAWNPIPATAVTDAERGREAVGGRRRGDADHDARDEPERACLQPLVERVRMVDRDGCVHPGNDLRSA